jgi:hypothetical protein
MKQETHMITRLTPIFCLLLALPVWAQNSDEMVERLVIPLSQPGQSGTLEVNQVYGGISVTGYEGNEVIIVARQKKMHSTETMKNGLRRIQNNSMALEVEEQDNHVEVVTKNWASEGRAALNLEIQVPKQFNLKLKNINDGTTRVEQVSGELEISNINEDITLIGISGSAVVDSINGTIKAVFKEVPVDSQLAFTSFNEDVDITLPAAVKADFKLQTEYGDIYTGFDIDFSTTPPQINREQDGGSYKVKLEKWVSGQANGGGAGIVLKSHSGDLIIRTDD